MEFPVTGLKAPYYAVIFSNTRRSSEGYAEVAARMITLASEQPGYLGHENVSNEGKTVFVSYWQNEDNIKHWKQNAEHLDAQRKGRERWYQAFQLRICKVERCYGFEADDQRRHTVFSRYQSFSGTDLISNGRTGKQIMTRHCGLLRAIPRCRRLTD